MNYSIQVALKSKMEFLYFVGSKGLTPTGNILGSGETSPLIVNLTFEFTALEYTSTDFSKTPTRSVAYFTVIFPEAPGLIGCLGQVGTVQPQAADTLVIINGLVPILVK